MTEEEVKKRAYWYNRETKKQISAAWITWRGRMKQEYGIEYVNSNPAMFTKRSFLEWYATMAQAIQDGNLMKREDVKKLEELGNVESFVEGTVSPKEG